MAEIIDCTISSDDEAPAPAPAPKRRVKQQTKHHVDKKPRISPAEDDDDDVEFLDENPFAPPPLPEPEADDDDDDDDEDVAITGSKGQNALQHFPHCRENCVVHLFATDPTKHCANCFCVVCDVPASRCAAWPQHCRLKYADPSTQSLRKQARAAALLQQAGGAPGADGGGAVAQPARFTIRELHQPDAATSMGALLRAVTQVWPVEAPAPQGLAAGTVLRPYQRQSLAFMLDIENARDSDSRVFRSTRWGGASDAARRLVVRRSWDGQDAVRDLADPRTAAPGEPAPDGRPVAGAAAAAPLRPERGGSAGDRPPVFLQGEGGRYLGLVQEEARPQIRSALRQARRAEPGARGLARGAEAAGRRPTLTLKATVISCPVTLIGQWQDEIRRWAPNLRILVNHGSHKDRNKLNMGASSPARAVFLTARLSPRNDWVLTTT